MFVISIIVNALPGIFPHNNIVDRNQKVDNIFVIKKNSRTAAVRFHRSAMKPSSGRAAVFFN